MKQLFLTPRDHRFLVDLYDLLFLDVEYLEENIYTSVAVSSIYNRVKLMERDGYIKSFRLPLQNPNPSGRSKKVFTLDKKGVDEVREIIGYVEWDQRWTDRVPLTVYHSLELAKVKSTYARHTSEKLKFHEWINETRAFHRYGQNNNDVIRPDGLLLLKTEQVNFSFMMELERSQQRKEISIKKLERYNDYCQLKAYKDQNVIDIDIIAPRIVFISNTETDMHRLMNHTQEADTSYTNGVMYTTMGELLDNPYGDIFLAKGSADPNKKYGIASRIIKQE